MARSRSAWLPALRQVWALAQLTIGEALRSRFLLAVVVLGVGLLLYAAQSPAVGDVDRAMLVRQTMLQVVGAIVIVATLFLAAFAVPGDVESRRIFTLLTKPITRWGVVAGRFLGFAVLALTLLAALGSVGAVVLASSLADADPREVAPRARVLPDQALLWGDGETILTRALGDGSRELLDPHHAGLMAQFRHLDRSMFDAADGPTLYLRTRLRLRQDRKVQPNEVAIVSAAPIGAGADEVWRTTVPVQSQEPLLVALPWQALGPEPDGTGWQTEVTVTVEGLPFSMVVSPDSVQLLGAPRSHVTTFLAMVMTIEAAKVLFVLAVVLALSCVFSPYTAILGGLFALLAANLVGQLPAGIQAFGAQLEHAHRLGFVDLSLAAVERILGDPNAESFNAWTLLRIFAEAFPSFDRYPLHADFVAGIMPEVRHLLGAAAYLLFWTALLVAGGAALFTMRDHP